MALYIVRHALAVPRKEWTGADAVRPLLPDGERQAEVIARWFEDRQVDRLLTSPALRCSATIASIAATHDVTVEKRRELQLDHEQAAIDLVRLLLAEPDDVVLCSHGEIIRPVLRSLRPATFSAPPTSCAKGSIWLVSTTTRGVEGVYHRNEDLAG